MNDLDLLNPKVSIILNCNKRFIVKDDIVTVTAIIKNESSVEIGNNKDTGIKIFSMLPKEVKFISDSLKINEIEYRKDEALTKEIKLNPLKPKEVVEFKFDILVVGEEVKDIKFNLVLTYGCIINNQILNYNKESNYIRLRIETAKLKITKNYDKKNLSLQDEIDCYVEIQNIGSLNIVNLIYKEEACNVLELIEDSFSVNDEILSCCNINQGIYIGNLPVKEKMVLKYRLKLISSVNKSEIYACSKLEYSFLLPNLLLGIQREILIEDEKNIFYINLSNFKQINIENYLTISEYNKPIQEINKIDADIEIISSHIIETIKEKSYEGQKLSGYKLVINGKINEIVEYTSCNEESSVNSEKFCYPFGTFIILGENFNIGSKIEIEGIIENINYKIINERSFYQDILILLSAKIYN